MLPVKLGNYGKSGTAPRPLNSRLDPLSLCHHKSGDYMNVLDVLARGVGILGIFSDWPGTVTYYANCMGLK